MYNKRFTYVAIIPDNFYVHVLDTYIEKNCLENKWIDMSLDDKYFFFTFRVVHTTLWFLSTIHNLNCLTS